MSLIVDRIIEATAAADQLTDSDYRMSVDANGVWIHIKRRCDEAGSSAQVEWFEIEEAKDNPLLPAIAQLHWLSTTLGRKAG